VDGVGVASRIKFAIDNVEYVSCSKKCQKVTKFSLILHRNDQIEILEAFQKMLEKRKNKANIIQSLQTTS